MANINEIRTRMKSIKDIMKITNAMYLISSSKLKKAKKSLLATSPYFEKLQSTIHDILVLAPHMHQIYFERREDIKAEDRKRGYIVITADKGLAGSYNHNVIKLAEEEIKKGENTSLFIIGQVGRQYFIRKNIKIDHEFLYTAQDPNLYRAREITETMLELFKTKQLDEVYIIYTKMVSPIKAEPKILKILPLERIKFKRANASGYKHATFEPSPEQVMEVLVPNYIKGLIYGALVQSFSSEQNSRMLAMQSATDSARDMLANLDLYYNRARQAGITQEITEIASGANNVQR